MIHTRARTRVATAMIATAAILGAGASPTFASHFRASAPDFHMHGDTAMWTLVSAWEKNDADAFVGFGGTVEVASIESYTDVPGSGSGTGVTLEVIDEDEDDTDPLYTATVEKLEGDLSSLEPGLYELFVSNCCRVDDIRNSSTDSFSQWVRFEKLGPGNYAVAPRLTTPTIYQALPLSGATTQLSYAATGGATWTVLTDNNHPVYGSDPLPCSTLSGGTLSVGSAHCSGGDVWADVFETGSFWAIKVLIRDSAGRDSVAETLFRVESLPEPYIDDHTWVGNGLSADFTVIAPDTTVDSWRVECVNLADDADVRVGTGTTSPIRVAGFTNGAEYECFVSATNGAGTGTSEWAYSLGTVELRGVVLALQLSVGDFYAGKSALIEGAGLDAESDYTLVMFSDPLPLFSGTADESGSFSEEVVIPEEACIPGVHEVRLTGLIDGSETTSSQWIEVDASCIVLQLSSDGPVTPTPTDDDTSGGGDGGDGGDGGGDQGGDGDEELAATGTAGTASGFVFALLLIVAGIAVLQRRSTSLSVMNRSRP